MADVTITGLPNASALTGSERVPMDQAGATVDAAASAIAALATKATVGLGNADNTSDASKPISTATQAALDGKVSSGGPLGTPSSGMLANATGLPLATGVTGILPVANGGTGTAAPGLVAGANVTITGAWPNQSIAAAGGGGGGGSGTVTSVGLVAPTGFSVSGSPVTVSGNITLAFAAGYSLPLDSSQANWNTAFAERLRWDGGSTGLDATTGRTSLGLGSLATQSGTFSGTSSGTNTGDNAVNTLYSGLVSNANHTGDATGSTALTLATVNANVGTFGSATAAGVVTVNAKGLITAASSATITPAVGSITGLGTGVATALAANVGSAGAPVVLGGALGTPSSGTLANATGLPLTTGVTGILPVASGGTGTATPGLVAGAHVSISGTWPNQTISATGGGGGGGGGGDALTTQPLSQFAATTSAQLRGVISDETGTGLLYFQGGDLGTPSSGTLTNATGLPLATGISGFGTGIAAALGIATGSAGAPVLFNGAGGTPSSLSLANATGLPAAAIGDSTTIGRAVLTAANTAAARTAIGAGTSSLVVSNAAPAALGATATAGSSPDAARIDHVHARSTYADLGPIADGIIFTISNRDETATARTNYDESLPLSFAVTVTKITFITHIDNTGSSTTTLSAYKRTAAGAKTALLSANTTLVSGASVAVGSLSGTAGVLSLAAGDRLGVDLIGLGTGASGIKCIIEYTRSPA
jgi:hypothetical protein